MSNKYFETTGTITKLEKLSSFDINILPNTLVLEIQEPFPGYHHEFGDKTKPDNLFFITTNPVARENIARAVKNIRKYVNFSFDAAAATILINNELMHGIRIKDIESFEHVSELQSCFLSEGFAFRKRRSINAVGLITVKKFFNICLYEPELLFDINPQMAYFIVSRQLSWKMFEEITKSIRNNWDFKYFDAAYGTIYHNGEIEDVVRIYWEKLDFDRLKLLHKKYNTELSRY